MGLFRKKSKKIEDDIYTRFQQAINLVKDLDKKEFARFVDGLTLAWQGYDRLRQVQTIDEKENGNPDIDKAEKILTKEVNNNYVKLKNKENKK